MRHHKAIFLDKDGTLITNVPYNADPAKIELIEGVAEGLQRLGSLGYLFFVVTNQAGVAKGFFTEEALTAVEDRLQHLLSNNGIALSGFYYCPHHPEGSVPVYAKACHCRKPMPGMLLEAALNNDVRLDQSWMVGDILDDVEAGNRAGCKTVLVDCAQHERAKISTDHQCPTFIADDFGEAANLIIKFTRNGEV
ncbi:D-glycero-alpha-D-manno-heptose-1,7-bisphosphate 7-phosphatase [Parapedobacter deserti]|uniref:D,D-heptose 1,7-bisphosphate phosphatase n=1 Tax=Parapedobacter deserti TaxID=1912957 RepID=A0ABV7JLT0_9SPHI